MSKQFITEEYLHNVASAICTKIDSTFSKKNHTISEISIGMARPTGSPYTNLKICLILTYDDDTVVNLAASELIGEIEVATSTKVGGVKAKTKTVGDGYDTEVKIDENGFLFIPESNVDIATSTNVGVVKPDNKTVTVAPDGTLAVVGGGTTPGGVPLSNISQLINDVGYITRDAIPTTLSSFNNDAGYVVDNDMPKATSTVFGAVKANAVTNEYTVQVRINEDGFLYVPELKAASNTKFGGIKASAVSSTDIYHTSDVKIDKNGFLHSEYPVLATNKRAGIVYAEKVSPTDTTYKNNVKINSDGYLCTPDYDIATDEDLGLIKANKITALDSKYSVQVKIDTDGFLYVPTVETATVSKTGAVKPDGSTILIDNDGTIHAIDQRTIDPTGAVVVYVSSLVNDAGYITENKLPTIDNKTIVADRNGNWKISDDFDPETKYSDAEVAFAIDQILK